MSDLNRYYDNYPEDRSDRKRRKKTVYSSKDFIPGIKGVLAKLFVSLTIFVMSSSFAVFILTNFYPMKDMLFVLCFSLVMMLASWGISVLLKNSRNIIKMIPIAALTVAAYWLSPYIPLVTFILLPYNLVVAFITVNRLNLPEKLALTQPLILVSCLFFCFYQIIMIINPEASEFSIEAMPYLMTTGVTWIMICVFAMNILSLSRVAAGRKLSKGLVTGNITMTVILSGLVLLVASAGAYKDFIFKIIRAIFAFIFGGTDSEEVPMETQAPEGGGFDLSQLMEESKSSPFWDFMDKVFYVLMIAVLAVILFFFVKKIIKVLSGVFSRVMSYLKANDASEAILSFEDKEESVFDKGQFNTLIKERLQKIRKSLTRKQKFSDMKDNREKVRFIYKSILQSDKKKASPVPKCKTAREYFCGKDGLTEGNFVEGYEKARYSSHDVTDEEVAAGLSITGKLK